MVGTEMGVVQMGRDPGGDGNLHLGFINNNQVKISHSSLARTIISET